MKKIIVAILLILAVLLWVRAYRSSIPAQQADVTPTPVAAGATVVSQVTIEGEQYAYSYILVTDITKLKLIPNFSEKLDSQTVLKNNSCVAGINAGFYDIDSTPLGLFYTNGTLYQEASINSLLNGFFWVDATRGFFISGEYTNLIPRMAIQSGPLLSLEGNSLLLKITSDEYARRMILAKTVDNKLVFITVYDKDNTFSGPRLADLPKFIPLFRLAEGINIKESMNLDGGSASAFYNSEVRLSELTAVGSMFCVL